MDGGNGANANGTSTREASVVVRRVHAATESQLYHITARIAFAPGWKCFYTHVRGDISSLSFRYLEDEGVWCIVYYTLASSQPVTYFEFHKKAHPVHNCSLTLSLHEDGSLVAVGSGMEATIKEKHD